VGLDGDGARHGPRHGVSGAGLDEDGGAPGHHIEGRLQCACGSHRSPMLPFARPARPCGHGALYTGCRAKPFQSAVSDALAPDDVRRLMSRESTRNAHTASSVARRWRSSRSRARGRCCRSVSVLLSTCRVVHLTGATSSNRDVDVMAPRCSGVARSLPRTRLASRPAARCPHHRGPPSTGADFNGR
jgi:hypothetical protein